MATRFFAIAALAFALTACAGAPPPRQVPFVSVRDPNVATFFADHTDAWTQFRLGGGLNVVVANGALPVAPAWRAVARKGTSASPVVAGTTVLIASNDHRLYALDGATGAQRWVWPTDNEIMTSPVYQSGTVYVGVGNADSLIQDPPVVALMGTGHSHLDALDLATGAHKWTYELNGTGMPSPALTNGKLIHFNGSGVLQAVDARTGDFRWRRLLYSIGTMSNVLLGDYGDLYISGLWQNAVYAFRTADGAPIWVHRFSNHFNAVSDCPLARSGDRIVSMYVAPASKDPNATAVWMRPGVQHIYALDARTGALLWDVQPPRVSGIIPAWNESAIPLISGGLVYDGSALAPIVSAVDLQTGRVRWQLRVNGPVKGGIVQRDGVIYFGDLAGTLWAVNASTGLALGSIKTDLSFNVGSPIVLNDSLVIGSQQGPTIAVPLAAIAQSRSIEGVTVAKPAPILAWAVAIFLAVLALLALAQFQRRAKRRRPLRA
jgi:outer membrane protein assembly factor BamB